MNDNDFKSDLKVTAGDLRAMFWRTAFLQASWNFERMQALGFAYSVSPVIKRLYSDDEGMRKLAIKRHLEFFNTHPYVAAPIVGIVAAMEEEKANGKEVDDGAINGIKVGLMGPLAGVGDPVYWGAARPVFASLGAGVALAGSILGPLLFFLLFNLVRLLTIYYGINYGYKKGVAIIGDMSSGILQKLTEGSSILGLFVIGALVQKWTKFDIPIVLGETSTTTIQSILDSLMPGLVPLLLTFLSMWLLHKKVNVLIIILGFFVFGILGVWAGVLR